LRVATAAGGEAGGGGWEPPTGVAPESLTGALGVGTSVFSPLCFLWHPFNIYL
jgi:hypothetical protein